MVYDLYKAVSKQYNTSINHQQHIDTRYKYKSELQSSLSASASNKITFT